MGLFGTSPADTEVGESFVLGVVFLYRSIKTMYNCYQKKPQANRMKVKSGI